MPSDFITDFMSMTEGLSSPPLFRLWSGIACVAGALERSRVIIRTGAGVIHPNQYVMLVAPPGVGKFVIETVRAMWSEATKPDTKANAFHVASDSVTSASLMDELVKAKVVNLPLAGPPITYHQLLLAMEELEYFLPAYDKQMVGALNSIYNNKDVHKESRRTGSVKDLKIDNPGFTMLIGTQPAYLANTFPEENWKTGLSRRVIMVFAADLPAKSLFFQPADVGKIRQSLVRRLGQMSTLQTELGWDPEAVTLIDGWYLGGGKPKPMHSKLENYAQPRNRSVLVIKLGIVSAISRGQYKILEKCDIERAMSWLLEAEKLMPDIFRAMMGKSDQAIQEEMHSFMCNLYQKQQRKPIPSESIYAFYSQYAPSEKIMKLFEAAEKSGIIRRVGGSADLYNPGVLPWTKGVE